MTRALRKLVIWDSAAKFAVLTLAVLLLITALQFPPPAIDWREVYRPATLALASGQSPYTVAQFYNPPWALIPLMPIAALPDWLARPALFVVGLAGYAVALRRLGAGRVSSAAFILSPFVIHDLIDGNIDWMPLLGMTIPNALGVMLLLTKPQMGAVVALSWLVNGIRDGGLSKAVRVFTPAAVVFLLSIAMFGAWPLAALGLRSAPSAVVDSAYPYSTNQSLWPWSILPGLALAAWSCLKRNDAGAFASAPMLSPRVTFHSWSAALILFVRTPRAMVVVVVSAWSVVALTSS